MTKWLQTFVLTKANNGDLEKLRDMAGWQNVNPAATLVQVAGESDRQRVRKRLMPLTAGG